MEAVVNFYSIRGSLSNRAFPVISSQPNPIYSVTIKCTEDMDQYLTVPEFNGYSDCNMVRINDSWYWIESYQTNTIYNGSVTFSLRYNPITSLLSPNSIRRMDVIRTPYEVSPYLSENVINDTMKKSRETLLPRITSPMVENEGGRVYWFELVTTAYKANITDPVVNGQFTRYAGFVPYYPNKGTQSERLNAHPLNIAFPSLDDIMNRPDQMISGITQETIVGLNISERCPYRYDTRLSGGGETAPYLMTFGSGGYAGPLSPTAFGEYAFYILEKSESSASHIAFMQDTDTVVSYDEMTRRTGSTVIKDAKGNILTTIPHQWIDDSGDVTVTARTISDVSGIYTLLKINDEDYMAMMEGRLAYVGDSWVSYQTYSQAYDRQIADNASYAAERRLVNDLELSHEEFNLRQLNNAASLNLFSPASWITTPLSIFEEYQYQQINRKNMIQSWLIDEQARSMDYYALQRKEQIQPGNSYDVPNGLTYCALSFINGAQIEDSIPANITQQFYNDFIAEMGYRSEGVHDISITNGYYQGRIISQTEYGPKFDRLNSEMINGLRIVII